MPHEKIVIAVVVIAVVVFIIWWSARNATKVDEVEGKADERARQLKAEVTDEYARLVGTAANAGRNIRNNIAGMVGGQPVPDVSTKEGYVTFQQEADNADSYDLTPSAYNNQAMDFVGDVNSEGGRNVPAALAGMSDAQIAKALQDMDNGRRFEDPRGQLPDVPITGSPFGYDIASPNNYKPVNTFGANYKLKGRNFEINLRGSIAPGEVWTGMFKPRGTNRTLMGGGLLESQENERRRMEFERARSRQVIRNGNSAEVIY